MSTTLSFLVVSCFDATMNHVNVSSWRREEDVILLADWTNLFRKIFTLGMDLCVLTESTNFLHKRNNDQILPISPLRNSMFDQTDC